jgi:hypothetical protein
MQGFKDDCFKIHATIKIRFQFILRQKQSHLCRCCQIEVFIYILNTKWKSNSLIPRQFCLGQYVGF